MPSSIGRRDDATGATTRGRWRVIVDGATAAHLDDPLIDVVIPVYNEVRVLEGSIALLAAYLAEHSPFRWRVVIADNASTDGTGALADRLAAGVAGVQAIHLDRKGRGHALKAAWSASDADIVTYMDVDLSTNLASFLPLVAPLVTGHGEVAIGTRLARQSNVTRQLKREVLSRGYNALVHVGFRARFSDAQCGFKAMRADVAHRLLPLVEDESWFFDTELLLQAERHHMRIHEVAVDWIEDLDSRVRLPSTIVDDLRGLWRVRRQFWRERRPAQPAVAPS